MEKWIADLEKKIENRNKDNQDGGKEYNVIRKNGHKDEKVKNSNWSLSLHNFDKTCQKKEKKKDVKL